MYLLLQTRTDYSGIHEYKCIYESLDIPYNELMQVNMASAFIKTKDIRKLAKQAKGIIIGGQGEVGYGETDPKKRLWLDNIRKKILPVLKETIRDPEKKILGICFGHQLLAEVLDAKVAYAPQQREVGIETLSLTPKGKNDPLFKGVSSSFKAILAHRDAVLELPKNTVHLASSKKCPIQAFRYKKNIYGVQFHPELDSQEFKQRLTFNGSKEYTLYNSTKDQQNTNIQTKKLIKNFLSL